MASDCSSGHPLGSCGHWVGQGRWKWGGRIYHGQGGGGSFSLPLGGGDRSYHGLGYTACHDSGTPSQGWGTSYQTCPPPPGSTWSRCPPAPPCTCPHGICGSPLGMFCAVGRELCTHKPSPAPQGRSCSHSALLSPSPPCLHTQYGLALASLSQPWSVSPPPSPAWTPRSSC